MTDSVLKNKIQQDVIAAMRAQDKPLLSTLRLLQAAIKQKEVDERKILDDADVLTVLTKMIKQRRESVEQFAAGNRQDLVDKENAEIQVLQAYLPAQMSEAEIEKIVSEIVKSLNASSLKDMGKVMGALKAKLQGKADMSIVNAKVKSMLGGC